MMINQDLQNIRRDTRENMYQGGNMQQANMQQGNMQQANMQQGNMQQGNMQQGNMQRANMQRAYMQQGNMNTKIKYLNNSIERENQFNKKYLVNDNLNLENKILNIIDNNNIKLSKSDKYKSESSILKNLPKEYLNNKPVISDNDKLNINVKNLINRDLKDSDKETTYNIEDNNNYREIFSNSIQRSEKKLDTKNEIVETRDIINTKDTQEKENLKNKKKFFNNYLHI